jgi:hypothetical protein
MTDSNETFDNVNAPIISDKAGYGVKDGYLMLYYKTHDRLAGIIAESNGTSDHRIRLYTRMMISMFTDDDIRKRTFEFFDARIAEITKETTDVEERNQRIADFCCGEMLGLITSYFDGFLGITHKIVIGSV